MSLLHKTEDIFKPAPPQEVDTRKQVGKEEYYKQLNAKSSKELIEELVEADMEQLNMDTNAFKHILLNGFKGYKNLSRQGLLDEYEAYFGGWEDHI